MKQSLPWNITGIPPEAREAARSAAMREGMSVGDWLTRRIFLEGGQSAPEMSAPPPPPPQQRAPQFHPPSPRFERDEETRRDRDDMVVRLSRAETETDGAFRRIDEALRNLSRRMETSERSQNEAQRTMSTAAAEINTAARDQALAFQHITQRIDSVERNSDSAALRDAVRGLHQGLSRLADSIAKTANESSAQIALLAKNMDTLAGKLAAARGETGRVEKVVEDRFHALGDRLKHADRIEQFVEERLNAFAERLKRSEERLDGDSRIEQTVATLQNQIQSTEERVQDEIARQLSSIERSIGSVSSRLDDNERRNDDGGVHAALQAITQRLDRTERRKESDDGLQDTLRGFSQRFDAAERKSAEILDHVRASLDESTKRIEAIESAAAKAKAAPTYDTGFEPIVSNFDLPPFPEAPPFPPIDMMPREQIVSAPLPDMFAPQAEAAASPTTQDYLAQARRAAQSASHANGGGRASQGGGGYASTGNVVDLDERKKTRRVSRPVAAAVLVLLALSAGLFVTRTFGPSNNIAGYAPGDQVALNTPPPAATNPPFPDNSFPPAGAVPPQNQIPAPTFEPPPRPPSANTGANSGTRVASAPPPPATAAPITQFPPQRTAPLNQLPAPTNNQFPPIQQARPAAPAAGAPAGFTPAPTTAQRPGGGTPQDRLMAKAGAGDVKAALLLGLKYADGATGSRSTMPKPPAGWRRPRWPASRSGNTASARSTRRAAASRWTPSRRRAGTRKRQGAATARRCTILPSPMPTAKASRRASPRPRAGSKRPPIWAWRIRSSISRCCMSAGWASAYRCPKPINGIPSPRPAATRNPRPASKRSPPRSRPPTRPRATGTRRRSRPRP